jgi:glutamine amidotransferase
MMITVFDYGAGNLHSLIKALALSGEGTEIRLESDPARCIVTDVLVLPGVGGFAPAAERLSPARAELRDAVLGGLPTLGICLGVQLLFSGSEEGEGEGLGVLAGDVTRVRGDRVPHIGWNRVESAGDPLLLASGLTSAYYANSFVCRPTDPSCVTAWSTHGADRFPAMIRAGSTIGVQFHPEKSSAPGVRFLLAALAELAGLAGVAR